MTEAERIQVVRWINEARDYGWQDGFHEGRKAGAQDAAKVLRSTRPNHNKGNGRASVQRSVTYASLQQFVAHGVEQ